MRPIPSLALAVAGLALGALATSARAATTPRQCFANRDIANYAQQDRRTVNVRTRFGDVYQIKLAGDCADLNSQRAVLFQSRGSEVCAGMDVTILVRDGIMQRRCDGQSVRKLTPDEAKALPSDGRP